MKKKKIVTKPSPREHGKPTKTLQTEQIAEVANPRILKKKKKKKPQYRAAEQIKSEITSKLEIPKGLKQT